MGLSSDTDTTSYIYGAFGMHFVSPAPVPGLSPVSQKVENSISIQFGGVPESIAQPEHRDSTSQASASECLLVIPGKLRFYVDANERVFVESLAEMDPYVFWGLVLSLTFSVVGLRRGFVPLHASAVCRSGVSVALAGQSGAGKSTTAATLLDLGHEAYSDDLCLVQWSPGGTAVIGAGLPELRLWDETAEVLGWSADQRIGSVENISKAIYRRKDSSRFTMPLTRIYALEFSGDPSQHGIHPIKGFEAMTTLMRCLRMRPGLVTNGLQYRLFESLARVSRDIEIFRFSRPSDKSRLQYWAERLAQHIDSPREAS